jgi:hypothetical protein
MGLYCVLLSNILGIPVSDSDTKISKHCETSRISRKEFWAEK